MYLIVQAHSPLISIIWQTHHPMAQTIHMAPTQHMDLLIDMVLGMARGTVLACTVQVMVLGMVLACTAHLACMVQGMALECMARAMGRMALECMVGVACMDLECMAEEECMEIIIP